ncbi:DMT family transporter [Pseudorhodoferax sp. Leaf267]|uniref:DMT family transporter n=1 Tax=Pseudorhodoferax sp. Leaf267 TaxID=1736316 RepID=UPI00210084C4|nr:DMT family transporter [Pseudorhodoferax sp. Leaf267]
MSSTNNRRGILAMLGAVSFFAWMDAVMKLLAAHYPAVQVAALRGLAGLPLVCLYVWWRGEAGRVLQVRWPLHLLRGGLGVAMLTLFAHGLQTLPMAAAYTLFFIAPILITLLSVPVLHERVRPAHWLAIGVGMAGVLVALRPDGDALMSWGALSVLAAAGCYAVSAIAGRLLTRTDSSASLVFWMTVLVATGATALAADGWVPLRAEHGWTIVALAVTGFIGQLCITEAFRHGQAAVVAPFEYAALAWAVALDWLLWRALPDGATLAGAAIIVASGLYLVRLERRAPA